MIPGAHRPQFAEGSRYGLRDLFTPLETLLSSGGDLRIAIDPATGLNDYGCAPQPSPETWNFASSTASSISERAHERAARAREELVHRSLFDEVEVAFDARTEDMREELRALLQLPPRVEIVFSPSGTDSQLHALFLARAALGARLATIVVGADQTGSGASYTARGRHFANLTASGFAVRKDSPVTGLACDSVALPLLAAAPDVGLRAEADAEVLRAVETKITQGFRVMLQVMDSSKLGWRAPSEACLDEVAKRWPGKVQVVVDACQMRIGRPRLRSHLDRGRLVLITGSKFFGGPAFSGALLVPEGLSRKLDRGMQIAPGFFDYASRSDWPKSWEALRSCFESRPNFGQWLRWEAALDDIGAYYAVPDAFRARALDELGAGIGRLLASTPSLTAIGSGAQQASPDDEEFAHATIFPVMLNRGGEPAAPADIHAIYRSLAAQRCLVGQPVRLERPGGTQAAALRLCVGAGLVTEAWSADAAVAQDNLRRILDRVARVLTKIELLLDRRDGTA